MLFCACVFSSLRIAITSFGEERANLNVFLYVCSICPCLILSVSSSSWCLARAAAYDCDAPWTFHLLRLLLFEALIQFKDMIKLDMLNSLLV